jgi:acyl carrier protein
MDDREAEIKRLIIETFDLEGLDIGDIDSAAPLFGEGLGLDSIDALELGVALKKKYDIQIDANTIDLAHHFASVHNLAALVASHQTARNPGEKRHAEP